MRWWFFAFISVFTVCLAILSAIREEGILILSGGLTVHNLQDRTSFTQETAKPLVRDFNDAVSSAISISDVSVLPHPSASSTSQY
jgi:aromatic ring-opening dioxygenase catalytic subunit (LigB family)